MTLLEVFIKLEAAGRRVAVRPDGVGGAMRIDIVIPSSAAPPHPSANGWVTLRLWEPLVLTDQINAERAPVIAELARRAGVDL